MGVHGSIFDINTTLSTWAVCGNISTAYILLLNKDICDAGVEAALNAGIISIPKIKQQGIFKNIPNYWKS